MNGGGGSPPFALSPSKGPAKPPPFALSLSKGHTNTHTLAYVSSVAAAIQSSRESRAPVMPCSTL